jgi:hypothetical protein
LGDLLTSGFYVTDADGGMPERKCLNLSGMAAEYRPTP